MLEITRLQEVSDETFDLIQKLISQLTQKPVNLSKGDFEEILNQPNVFVFVAKVNNIIVGTFSLFQYYSLSGKKISLEDVVVDENARGLKIGQRMVDFAINYSSKVLQINQIDLTTNPTRLVANTLYEKMGFKQRTTNVYRWIHE